MSEVVETQLHELRLGQAKALVAGSEIIAVVPETIKPLIEDVLVQTLMDATSLCKVRLPRMIRFPSEDEQRLMEDAEFGISQDFDEGMHWTRYRVDLIVVPKVFTEIITQLTAANPVLRMQGLNRLRTGIAHEVYHQRALRKWPKRRIRNIVKQQTDDNAYFQNHEELAAELFALKYLKERETDGWKDKLEKFMGVLWMSRDVYALLKLRRKLMES